LLDGLAARERCRMDGGSVATHVLRAQADALRHGGGQDWGSALGPTTQ